MSLFEVSHYLPEKSLYDQGFILLQHLSILGIKIFLGGEIY